MAKKFLNGILNTGTAVLSTAVASSGNQTILLVSGSADTAQTLSTEKVDVDIALNRTVEWATGNLTTQRAVVVRAPTYRFVGASVIATAATFAISGAPIAGANATITNPYALWVQSGNVQFDSVTTTLNAGTTTVNTACLATGSIADFLQYDVKNTSTGTGAQSGYSATADNGTPTTGFAFMGINNSGTPLVATYNIGGANDVNVMGSGQDMYLANANNTKSIFISLGKAASPYFFNVFEWGNNSGVGKIVATTATFTWTQTATTGTTAGFLVTGAAHTALTASTEAIDVNLNLARTVQFATGALTTQRGMLVQAPTYAFVGASVITNAATLAISGAPVAGTNATLTNTMALWVQSGTARFDGVALISAGTAALPGLAIFGNANTGIYSVSTNQLGISTGGVLRFDVSSTAVTSTLLLVAPASTTSAASIRMPHGTAPTSPVNGDEWTTSAGKFVRINGVTYNTTRLVFALTDAATIAVDAAVGDVFTVTLAGNRTMGAPTNPVDGRTALFRIRQDATGSRTLAWNAAFAFATNLPVPVLSTAANKVDYVGFIYNGVTAKWECLSYLLGHN